MELAGGQKITLKAMSQAALTARRAEHPQNEAASITSWLADNVDAIPDNVRGEKPVPTDSAAWFDLDQATQDRYRHHVPAYGYSQITTPAGSNIPAEAAVFLASGIEQYGRPGRGIITEEIVHALRDMGLISDQQVRQLAQSVRPGLTEQVDIDEAAAAAVYTHRLHGRRGAGLSRRLSEALRRAYQFIAGLLGEHARAAGAADKIVRDILSGKGVRDIFLALG